MFRQINLIHDIFFYEWEASFKIVMPLLFKRDKYRSLCGDNWKVEGKAAIKYQINNEWIGRGLNLQSVSIRVNEAL